MVAKEKRVGLDSKIRSNCFHGGTSFFYIEFETVSRLTILFVLFFPRFVLYKSPECYTVRDIV